MAYVCEFTTDGSSVLNQPIVDLIVAEACSRAFRITGFATGDTITSIKMYAKVDATDADGDADTITLTATLTTPTRDPNARLATFALSGANTTSLLTGRVYRVEVIATRSAVQYTIVVAVGFIAAAYPGQTVTAPSDEAALRAAGDATVTTLANTKVATVTGTSARITIGGTATAPTVDIAATYVGQSSITTLGTLAALAVTGISTLIGAVNVTGTVTATAFAGPLTGNVTGNVTGNITGTAPAGSLTGTTLAANVVSSSLTTVGTLGSLTVSGAATAASFRPASGVLGWYPTLGSETGVASNVYGYDDIRRWIPDATALTARQTTVAIRNALTSVGNYGRLLFPITATYTIDGQITLSEGQQLFLGGATIRRRAEITDTTTSAIAAGAGAQTITVTNGAQWTVGQTVTVYDPAARSGASAEGQQAGTGIELLAHEITAINGNVLSLAGNFVRAFPSGGTVVLVFDMIVTTDGTITTGVGLFGGILDGNAANNTTLQRWELTSSAYIHSHYGVVDGTKFINAAADGLLMEGDGFRFQNLRFVDCQGNGTHMGVMANWQASNLWYKNTNIGGQGVGHYDGAFCFSLGCGDGQATGIYAENALAVIGNISVDIDSEVTFANVVGRDCDRSLEIRCADTNAGIVSLTGFRFVNCVSLNLIETSGIDATKGPYRIKLAHGELDDTRIVITRGHGIVLDDVTVDLTGDTTNNCVAVAASDNVTITSSCRFIGGAIGVYASGICTNVDLGGTATNQYNNGYYADVASGSSRVRVRGVSIANTTASATTYDAINIANGVTVTDCDVNILKGRYGVSCPNGGSGVTGAIVENNRIRTPVGCPSIRIFGGAVNNYVRNNGYSQAISDSGGAFNVVSGNYVLDATCAAPPVTFGAVTASTVTATTFTGALVGNASTATALASGRTIGITGDLVWTSPSFDGSGNVTAAGTLATVNSNVGSYGSASAIPVITVNGKGLVTAVSTAALTYAGSALTGTSLAASIVTSSLTTVGILASPHFTSPVVDSGGLTITAGALTVSNGALSVAGGAITALAGAIISGNGSGSVYMSLDGGAGNYRPVNYLTGGSLRWAVGPNNATESGANAGSNYTIIAYTDAAATIDTPLTIVRAASGLITLARPVTVSGALTASVGLTVTTGGITATAQDVACATVTYASLLKYGSGSGSAGSYDITASSGPRVLFGSDNTGYAFSVAKFVSAVATQLFRVTDNAGTIITSGADRTGLTVTGGGLTGASASTTLDITETWNTSGAPTAIRLSVTNTASGGSPRMLDLRAGAGGTTSVFLVGVSGSITTTGSAYFGGGAVTTASTTGFVIENRGSLAGGSATGILTLLNAAGTGFTRLNIGGTTTSFAALAVSGTEISTCRGDGSAGGTFVINSSGLGAGVAALRINGTTTGAGVGAGTLTNAPTAGDPTYWMPINVAGTVRYAPLW